MIRSWDPHGWHGEVPCWWNVSTVGFEGSQFGLSPGEVGWDWCHSKESLVGLVLRAVTEPVTWAQESRSTGTAGVAEQVVVRGIVGAFFVCPHGHE